MTHDCLRTIYCPLCRTSVQAPVDSEIAQCEGCGELLFVWTDEGMEPPTPRELQNEMLEVENMAGGSCGK